MLMPFIIAIIFVVAVDMSGMLLNDFLTNLLYVREEGDAAPKSVPRTVKKEPVKQVSRPPRKTENDDVFNTPSVSRKDTFDALSEIYRED